MSATTNMIHVTHGTQARIEGFFERNVKWLLDHAFVSHSFFALSETAKYKPSMDENVWRQNRGERDEYVEIYHKGEWLCDVHSGMKRDEIVNKVARTLGGKIEKEKMIEEQKGVKK